MTGGVWYAAYGSNLSPRRFAFYLRGGRPPGTAHVYPGCLRPPSRLPAPRPLRVPGGVHFAGTSRVWGGGMAFFDPALPGTALLTAYPLAPDRFLDVAAQEMHLPPGGGTGPRVSDLVPGRTLRLWPGRYGAVEVLGRIGGDPVVTLTHGGEPVGPASPPTSRYLAWIICGLVEVHRLDRSVIVRYLAGLPGIGRDAAVLDAEVRAAGHPDGAPLTPARASDARARCTP